jgi:hypothetical protein
MHQRPIPARTSTLTVAPRHATRGLFSRWPAQFHQSDRLPAALDMVMQWGLHLCRALANRHHRALVLRRLAAVAGRAAWLCRQ